MKTNQEEPKKREPGFYWVRFDGSPVYSICELDGKDWWAIGGDEGVNQRDENKVFIEIGPRIIRESPQKEEQRKSSIYKEWAAEDKERFKKEIEALDKVYDEFRQRYYDSIAQVTNENDQLKKQIESIAPKEEQDELSGWISVKDRLPEAGDEYNVVWEFEVGNPVVSTMEYNAQTKEWIDVSGFNSNCTNEVTHWMDLPNPPVKNFGETKNRNDDQER